MPDPDEDADRRTLQRLALAEWNEKAAAQVISVTVIGNRAEVALVVNGDYEYWSYFQRDEEGWRETVEGNGPIVGWEHPGDIEWG